MENQKSYEVKTEKLIQKPVSEVFQALAEGRLFMNCGADSGSMKIEFKVGGQYRIDFKNYGIANTGEFLEIIPNKKIVFSWCSSFEQPLTPDSKVTIELFPNENNTRLLLVHSGFKTESSRSDHQGGWEGGLADFSTEIQIGRIRMVRVFDVPVTTLYNFCIDFKKLFEPVAIGKPAQYEFKIGGKYEIQSKEDHVVRGEFLEIIPNKKIVLSWNLSSGGEKTDFETQVTLNFDEEDDGGSSLELIHEHLTTEKLLKSHRLGWETVTQSMAIWI